MIVQSVLFVSSAIIPSVSPELISKLDSRVRFDLQTIDDRFFFWVAASAIIVALGCLMEGPEIFHELWPKTYPYFAGRWVKKVALIGWLLVVLGVAAEGVFEIYDHDASGMLQTFDEVLLVEAQHNAGDAQLSASVASDAARTAREQSDAATTASANARTLATGAAKEAGELTQEITDAKKQSADASSKAADAVSRLADAESRLADATQRELAAEVELSRLKTPRSLTDADALVAAIKPFAGIEFTLQTFGDQESFDLTREISKALHDAGWVQKQPTEHPIGLQYFKLGDDKDLDNIPGCFAVGVEVHVRSAVPLATILSTAVADLPKDVQIALSLRNALAPNIAPSDNRNVGSRVSIEDATDIAKYKGMGDGPVIVCIGKKP